MFARFLPFLRLIRFSNAPTAAADVLAGFLLGLGATGSTELFSEVPIWPLAAAVVSSVCLYSWGMVLNDLYDYQEDLANRSKRPLPAGEISLTAARWIAIVLWVIGLAAFALGTAFLGGSWANPATKMIVPSLVFFCLTATIWLYDGPLKTTGVAPFVMGGCRGLNLLMGAAFPLVIGLEAGNTIPADLWICVLASTAYVSGVTWIARREEQGGLLWQLILGTCLMLSAFAVLGFGLVPVADRPAIRLELVKPNGVDWYWPLAIGLIAFPVIRKAMTAIRKPSPLTIKLAVIAALGNLVFINAAICLYAHVRYWQVALIVALLIVPITFLKRYIPPT